MAPTFISGMTTSTVDLTSIGHAAITNHNSRTSSSSPQSWEWHYNLGAICPLASVPIVLHLTPKHHTAGELGEESEKQPLTGHWPWPWELDDLDERKHKVFWGPKSRGPDEVSDMLLAYHNSGPQNGVTWLLRQLDGMTREERHEYYLYHYGYREYQILCDLLPEPPRDEIDDDFEHGDVD